MKIIFLGQPKSRNGKARITELQLQAVKNGYSVIHKNNGFVENIISILTSRVTLPNTIHVHTWNMAITLAVLQIFLPSYTTTIWTIESTSPLLPVFKKSFFNHFFAIIAASFTQRCVPTRTLQYRLLAEYGIKAFYIPDGYTEPILEDIQPREYGLRNNQYGVLLSESIDGISQIAEAYKQTKSKKKLVIFSQDISGELKKIIKAYPFFTTLPLPIASRGARSVARAAGFVIMCDPAYSPILLQAMDANRVIIATTDPLQEEILGTTGFYYQEDDASHLVDLMAKATKDSLLPKYSPSVRAKHHFTWEKSGLEYEHYYTRKQTKVVPFDSLVPKNSFQRAL